MSNIMVRMGVVIGILLAVQLGFLYVGHLAHPAVVGPQQPLDDFPLVVHTPTTGTWEGKNAQLDGRSFNESEVDPGAVSRIYVKENRNLKVLLATYQSPRTGLYHNPMNCYHTHGFIQLGDAERQPLKAVENRPATEISVTTWANREKAGEKVIVAYWYEVGDYTMYERQDLLSTQWAMFGKTKWPVMFKVLLEMPAEDADQSKAEILEFAQVVRQWLGHVQPVVD